MNLKEHAEKIYFRHENLLKSSRFVPLISWLWSFYRVTVTGTVYATVQ